MTRIERDGDRFFIAVPKGDERYVFVFDRDHIGEVLRTLSRFADNQDLSFTWYDAAKVGRTVRECWEGDCG